MGTNSIVHSFTSVAVPAQNLNMVWIIISPDPKLKCESRILVFLILLLHISIIVYMIKCKKKYLVLAATDAFISVVRKQIFL